MNSNQQRSAYYLVRHLLGCPECCCPVWSPRRGHNACSSDQVHSRRRHAALEAAGKHRVRGWKRRHDSSTVGAVPHPHTCCTHTHTRTRTHTHTCTRTRSTRYNRCVQKPVHIAAQVSCGLVGVGVAGKAAHGSVAHGPEVVHMSRAAHVATSQQVRPRHTHNAGDGGGQGAHSWAGTTTGTTLPRVHRHHRAVSTTTEQEAGGVRAGTPSHGHDVCGCPPSGHCPPRARIHDTA